MKKFLVVLLVIVGIALYLNIGWVLGTFFNYTTHHEPVSWLDKVVTLDGALVEEPEKAAKLLLTDQIMSSLFWPFLILITLGFWLVKGLLYILWLIFAGGIAKLLGLG